MNQLPLKKMIYWIQLNDSYILGYNEQLKLIDKSEMYGKWNDILVNAKWTHKKDGFFKIWINGIDLLFTKRQEIKKRVKKRNFILVYIDHSCLEHLDQIQIK